MPTCSNCGATVRESARFCTSCGTRLNEPAAPTSSDWSTATEAPAVDTSSSSATSVWESVRQEVRAETGDTSIAAPARTSDDAQPAADASGDDGPEDETVNEEAFTWSWNTAATRDHDATETDGGDVAPPVDDESSVIIIDTGEPDERVDDAPDLTEVEIRDESPEVSDVVAGEDGIATGESASDEPAPDTAEVEDLLDAPEDDIENQETLAAWATQWNTPVEPATTVDDEQAPGEVDALPRTDQGATETTAAAFDPYASPVVPDDEDTIAKAERLIGELRAIIPTLARPKPAQPALSRDPGELANDLDNAAKLGDWDELRQVLLKSRDNPRDIDNMLNLTNNVDQILELLDDRNNLAKTATNVAAHLRQPADRSSEI